MRISLCGPWGLGFCAASAKSSITKKVSPPVSRLWDRGLRWRDLTSQTWVLHAPTSVMKQLFLNAGLAVRSLCAVCEKLLQSFRQTTRHSYGAKNGGVYMYKCINHDRISCCRLRGSKPRELGTAGSRAPSHAVSVRVP